ncbi:MAG: NAD(P)(+) transhydrogenase (Re/Si-specific) subunit beta [Planctomycetes bacterium]|nr:NAD(P)(+) transhydrogenase (Re/Si-specific) subunit beta [Planctomycetota bacterium]MBU4400363.1 NAD(P)(+) transhydrogenase (Re/Si-specific) subunit beta [Planctomycetota bacterium]
MNPAYLDLAYVLAAVLFIIGLKGLCRPRTAVRGNILGATGMLIAVLATVPMMLKEGQDKHIMTTVGLVVAAVLIGSVIGALLALKIRMTTMPQMVALLNGFGGGASVLVAGAEQLAKGGSGGLVVAVATVASGLIGGVTFWGSLVAFAKLEEYKWFKKPCYYPGLRTINALLGIIAIVLFVWGVMHPESTAIYWALVLLASVLGLTLVNPIGGADMPVVIALLNSYSGLAAASTGFVLGNSVLIIAGALVGALGIILTQIMCKAMNRSMTNVLFGTLGPGEGAQTADEVYGGKVKSTTADEVAMMLDGARRVVIVPGYGMAVAQAQHAVSELSELLESRGVEVDFAIHPVAGRMPGHMNVLLAEADVPYDKLKEMDEVNPTFSQTDVAIVIGANDVVNPVARTDPNSPIAGMPILDVDKARTVVIIKRSLSPGFAGIPNPLFAADNTLMYFADGKKAILDLLMALKE